MIDDAPLNKNAWTGRSRLRVEDDRLLRGQGQFTSDIKPDNCLHVAFQRAPLPAAHITSVDTDGADGAGVVATYTGYDMRGLGDFAVNPIVEGVWAPPLQCLARDEVFAVGQPVAVTVAETRDQARDAVEQVFVDYEEIDVESDLHADCPGNVAFCRDWQQGDPVSASTTCRVSVQISHPRLTAMALEPRAVVADWQGDRLTVWLPTQTPHRARTDLAGQLGLAADQVRVISVDVGGAFGARGSLHPEDVLVAWIALKLKRPVKWVADRGEDFQAQVHGRGTICQAEASFDDVGRMTGLDARIDGLLGHWLPFSAVVPAWNAARILPGPYDVADVDIRMSARLSRTTGVNIYRGAGRPEAAMLMERLMDQAARDLDMDPVEIRHRNLLTADRLPHDGPTGIRLDSGDYPAALKKLTEAGNYPGLRSQQARRRENGELVGIGLAMYVEPCGQGWESARVCIEADGRVIIATGSSAQGQGRETACQQIVADVLDVEPSTIQVIHGDTELAPAGIGALASRSTAIGGSALLLAAREVAVQRQNEPERGSYKAEVVYEADGEAWSYGACLAQVAIDADTGVVAVEKLVWVDDAGLIVNPALVKGQIMGGVAQGLGEALMEKIVYDGDGQLLTGSLMDYAVPRAIDMPEVDIRQMTTLSPNNVLGAKGVGEAGTIGAPAAIMNGLLDALAPVGVRHLDMPATSEIVWQAIKRAKTEEGLQ